MTDKQIEAMKLLDSVVYGWAATYGEEFSIPAEAFTQDIVECAIALLGLNDGVLEDADNGVGEEW